MLLRHVAAVLILAIDERKRALEVQSAIHIHRVQVVHLLLRQHFHLITLLRLARLSERLLVLERLELVGLLADQLVQALVVGDVGCRSGGCSCIPTSLLFVR